MSNGFFKKFATPKDRVKKEIYYEDLYGSPNEDEEFDRYPDSCESEVDSDDEESKKFTKSQEYKRLLGRNRAGASARGGKTAQPTRTALDEQKKPSRSEKRYKIAPNMNRKRSVTLASWDSSDTEDQDGINGSPSAAVEMRRRSLRGLAPGQVTRSAGRRLFKQDLAEHDKEKAQRSRKQKQEDAEREKEEKREKRVARKKEKMAERHALLSRKLANKPRHTNKKAKSTADLGDANEESKIAKAYVLIDLTGIDVEEYERF